MRGHAAHVGRGRRRGPPRHRQRGRQGRRASRRRPERPRRAPRGGGAPRREGPRDHDAALPRSSRRRAREHRRAARRAHPACVRAATPDVVIAPDPDCGVLRRSLREPSRPPRARLGGARHRRLDGRRRAVRTAAGPPHQLATLLLAGTLEPDTWVDIEAAIDAKLAALRCHESQVGDGVDVVADLVEARAAEAGRQAGVRYAEGFRRLSFRPR